VKETMDPEKTFHACIVFKYGLSDEEPDKVYNLGNLVEGKWGLKLTEITEPIKLQNEYKIWSQQTELNIKERSTRRKPRTSQGFMTEAEAEEEDRKKKR